MGRNAAVHRLNAWTSHYWRTESCSHEPGTARCCDVHLLGQEDRIMYRREPASLPCCGFGIAASVSWSKGSERSCQFLPKPVKTGIVTCMGTMNISLPDHLKSFVDEQVAGRGYGTSSEYIRELIRRDQDRLALRRLLLDGASSAPTEPVDADYFTSLRDRVRGEHSK